ncbi:MAG: hypothetical protein PUG00_10490, partial [Clostridiales bacterium]|nr:hypothetical protein [Clostridiales bacterium]
MRKIKQFIAVMLVVCMIATLCPADVSAAATKPVVKSVKVTNLATNKLVLKKGKKFQIKTKVTVKGKVSKKVVYATSNSKIVKVNSKGVV